MTGEPTPQLKLLTEELCHIFDVHEIDPDVKLSELGIDSIFLVEMALVFEGLYAKKVEVDRLYIDEHTTLRELDQQIREM